MYVHVGTPTERSWPGVSKLPDYKSTFPNWQARSLGQTVTRLDEDGLSILAVRPSSLACSFIYQLHYFLLLFIVCSNCMGIIPVPVNCALDLRKFNFLQKHKCDSKEFEVLCNRYSIAQSHRWFRDCLWDAFLCHLASFYFELLFRPTFYCFFVYTFCVGVSVCLIRHCMRIKVNMNVDLLYN